MAANSPDWFLRAWVEDSGKRQADLVKELGWHKNQAYRLWHGEQPYRREEVNAVAAWLGIEPFELLMLPDDAKQVRRVRELLRNEVKASVKADSRGGRTGTSG